eukprot:2067340-Alexandrium_andersonii.AAC.1
MDDSKGHGGAVAFSGHTLDYSYEVLIGEVPPAPRIQGLHGYILHEVVKLMHFWFKGKQGGVLANCQMG